MIEYRRLEEKEICRELFGQFIRRQEVGKCWRRVDGEWVIRDDPFVDDWTEEDYRKLVACLQNTLATGGFASVEAALFGGEQGYLDLSSIHVSQDMRGQGVGRALFLAAKGWARERGGRKLYISAHSAVESQAFYKAMGCVEAEVYHQGHVEEEPYDCQLECGL